MKQIRIRPYTCVVATAFSLLSLLGIAHGQEAATDEVVKKSTPTKVAKAVDVSLAGGALNVKIPAGWKQKPTRSSIVEREYSVKPAKGDTNPGRLTMMVSGGGLKLNIDRWIGQFSQSDGKLTKDVAKVVEKKIGTLKVNIVDISGDFNESVGPPIRRQTVKREDYRMLGAIVQAKEFGQRAYFFKLYGPKKTMAKAEKPFMAMIDSVTQPKSK